MATNGCQIGNRDKSPGLCHAETMVQVTYLVVSGGLLEKAIGRTANATENALVIGTVTGSVTRSVTGSERKKRIVVSATETVTVTGIGIDIVGMIRIVIGIRGRSVTDPAGQQLYPPDPLQLRKLADCRLGLTQVDIAALDNQVTMPLEKGDVPPKTRLIGPPNGAHARIVIGKIAVDAPRRKVMTEVGNPIGADQSVNHRMATHAHR